MKRHDYSVLTEQIRLKSEPRQKTEYIDESKLHQHYKITEKPDLGLVGMTVRVVNVDKEKSNLALKRHPIKIKPNKV